MTAPTPPAGQAGLDVERLAEVRWPIRPGEPTPTALLAVIDSLLVLLGVPPRGTERATKSSAPRQGRPRPWKAVRHPPQRRREHGDRLDLRHPDDRTGSPNDPPSRRGHLLPSPRTASCQRLAVGRRHDPGDRLRNPNDHDA